ncbi:hypothetical protein QYE76_044154 [Lolium multiflorum]|uniref:Protein FAR1-RELATED SEQUENCE n=1 Tax=Lolium multiflorum TaxID=4521 RepID=A0AAD8TKJ6_LOLMU|nr:hypothetical protein QYE76_044154 [Lolium multiflorum]
MGDTTPGNGTRSYSTFNNLEDDCGGMDVTSQNKDNNVGPIEESMRKYCEDKKTVMFKPEVGMEFYSSEEAYQFYNMYSWVVGFSIRLGDNYTNKKKERTMQEYLYQRQGTDNETKYSTTRCGCKAMMRVSINDNYVWYVKKFVEFVSMMGGKAPQTMLTDQSLAMTIAIRENLLDTNHRWCKWHVLRKAQEALGHVHRVHNTFSDDFNKVVNHMLTPEEFEAGWGYLTRTYDLSDNPFMIRAYEVRDKWAKPYFNDIFCARMSSTQRSESANHVLKVYVPCKSSINMFVKQYTKLIDDRERADEEAEKNKSQQAGEIDNLTVSLGQSTLVVLCRFHIGAGIPGVAPHYIPPPSTFNVLLGSSWTKFFFAEFIGFSCWRYLYVHHFGAATKLLDDMMINYSEWHTERAPQGKKVNFVEETSSLSDKIDVIMSMLVNGRSNVDPNNVPLASLVAQEENVDVNFIKNNNFNNNAYRNNSGNNYRPYPSANGNGYGNSYGNSYNNNRSVPSGLEAMLKEFISTQTAFNKSVEEKLDKIDILASRVDRLASDVDLLKSKVMPNEDIENKIVTTANAIQVRINENIRLMAELRARWDREENEKLAKENNVAKVWTITTTSKANDSHVAAPPTINDKIIGVGNVSTPSAKRAKLPEIAKTAETACDKTAEIFSNLGDDNPIALDCNDLDFDDCHISEVIKFLQKLAKSPNASAINLAFTKHITNALIKAREEKLKLETSIPRKLEDGWEPIIKMRVNDFDCNVLCDLGASISVMPKKVYDMLDLPPLKNCYLDVNLADNAKKKPLGRVDNVHIMVNNNLVPVDFVVLDIECNASCPIILGRPFLRTVGATIDMKEGNIKYQFPLKKGMEHFPRKRMKLPYDSIIRTNYDVDASSLDVT